MMCYWGESEYEDEMVERTGTHWWCYLWWCCCIWWLYSESDVSSDTIYVFYVCDIALYTGNMDEYAMWYDNMDDRAMDMYDDARALMITIRICLRRVGWCVWFTWVRYVWFYVVWMWLSNGCSRVPHGSLHGLVCIWTSHPLLVLWTLSMRRSSHDPLVATSTCAPLRSSVSLYIVCTVCGVV